MEAATAAGARSDEAAHPSATGRRWLMRPVDEQRVALLAAAHGLPELVARVLAARGVAVEEAPRFLDPRVRDCLPDPSTLADMDRAAARLVAAIEAREPITVFGDYDVDGATSSALLLRFFAAVGGRADFYVPDRLREGYGPSAAALLALHRKGTRLVVAVDCGSSAGAAIEAAAGVGLDVVVIDHHQCPDPPPAPFALVNPRRPDDASGMGHLAAVGVAFLLVVAVNRALRARGWFGAGRVEPDLKRWLDLVALGTVCDMVPLTGVNRAFVAQGVKVIAANGNGGLRALRRVARLAHPPSARDLAFSLGPRVNAGGRVGASDLGGRLLAGDDDEEASRLAARLDGHNRERRRLEQDVVKAALAAAQAGSADLGGCVLVAGEGWHPGVIGVVASRLVERLMKPALVVALDGERAVGSGRSTPGIDLGAAIRAADAAGLLLKGGGHAMACGFSAERGRLGELAAFLAAAIVHDDASADEARTLRLDGALSPIGVNDALTRQLQRLAPFGPGHPEPRFALRAALLVSVAPAGDFGLRCAIVAAPGDDDRVWAFAHRGADGPLGRALRQAEGQTIDLAVRVQPGARGAQARPTLLIDDAAWPA